MNQRDAMAELEVTKEAYDQLLEKLKFWKEEQRRLLKQLAQEARHASDSPSHEALRLQAQLEELTPASPSSMPGSRACASLASGVPQDEAVALIPMRWLTVRNLLLLIVLLVLLLVLTNCASVPDPQPHPRAVVDHAPVHGQHP